MRWCSILVKAMKRDQGVGVRVPIRGPVVKAMDAGSKGWGSSSSSGSYRPFPLPSLRIVVSLPRCSHSNETQHILQGLHVQDIQVKLKQIKQKVYVIKSE